MTYTTLPLSAREARQEADEIWSRTGRVFGGSFATASAVETARADLVKMRGALDRLIWELEK